MDRTEARYFDEDGIYEDAVDQFDLASRRDGLEQEIRAAAEVIVDLQDQGPLYRYALSRRAAAISALAALAVTEPGDVATIAAHQAVVREFRAACQWIQDMLNRGKQAEDLNQQEFGDGKEE